MKLLKVAIISSVMSLSAVIFADGNKEDIERIKKQVAKELKKEASSIKESPIKGLYEVTVGSQVFYFYKDARYVIAGDMFDMTKGLNLTQDARSKAQLAALRVPNQINIDAIKKMGEENMIVFKPKGKVKHTISVFTDIDCSYCRKLHKEMASYNKLGIQVQYLAYPRSGVGSASYKKAVSVWCSDDRQKAMTTAKTGGNLAAKKCDNPVKSQMALGQQMGVNGTPAIVLPTGQLYPGYAPANKLFQILEAASQQAKK